MMRKALLFCLLVFAAAVFASVARAERRVALVIGNSEYRNASPLPNTINDANAVATLFRSVGFEVVSSRNELGVLEFKRAVRDFLITAETADIAVVYYAGHGIEVNGANFLIPVDAKLARDYDVEDEAVALDRIVWALQPVRRLRLILLDACRDNPFAARLQRSVSTRAAPKGGLGKIDDVSADTLVAYAAKEGSVSYDGAGSNSPFAAALVKHIAEPGLDIRIALGRVRDEVLRTTAGRQEPFIYGSLGGSIIPVGAVAGRQGARSDGEPRPGRAAVRRARHAGAGRHQATRRARRPSCRRPSPPSRRPPRRPASRARACSRDYRRRSRKRIRHRLATVMSSGWHGCAQCPPPTRSSASSVSSASTRLKPQVQRLFESIATTLPAAAIPLVAAPPAGAPPIAAPRKEEPKREEAKREEPRKEQPPALAATREQSVAATDTQGACTRDAERLAQLRSDPSVDAIERFDRELRCERLRAQLGRLRESLQ